MSDWSMWGWPVWDWPGWTALAAITGAGVLVLSAWALRSANATARYAVNAAARQDALRMYRDQLLRLASLSHQLPDSATEWTPEEGEVLREVTAIVRVIPADVAEIGNLRVQFGTPEDEQEFAARGFQSMSEILCNGGGGGAGSDIPSVVYQNDIRAALAKLANIS